MKMRPLYKYIFPDGNVYFEQNRKIEIPGFQFDCLVLVDREGNVVEKSDWLLHDFKKDWPDFGAAFKKHHKGAQ